MDEQLALYITFVILMGIVYGAVLLFWKLKKTLNKERAKAAAYLTAIITGIIILLISLQDIFRHSTASRVSGAVVIIVFFFWFMWTFFYAHPKLKKQEEDARTHYIFSFPAQDYIPLDGWADSQITEFLKDYNMGIYVFENDIVKRGIEDKMREYRERHPLPDD